MTRRTRATRAGRRTAVAAIGAVALSLGSAAVPGLAPSALAHDSVIASEPADGSSVDAFPRHIELTFSGEPRPNFNTVAVSDSGAGSVLFSAEPTLDGRVVSVDVPADVDPGPGDYVVGFQITSSDGHSTRGKVSFSVGGGDVAAPSARDVPDAGRATPAWVAWGGGALALVVVGVIAGVAAFTRKDRSTP